MTRWMRAAAVLEWEASDRSRRLDRSRRTETEAPVVAFPSTSAKFLDARQVMHLQRTIGNAATTELIQRARHVQRCAEDGLIEGTCADCGKSAVQRAGDAGAPPMVAGSAGAAAPAAAGPTDAGTGDAGTPTMTVTRQGGVDKTFISTDQVSFTAQVTGGAADAAAHVSWTVTGVSANAGNGNPHTAANTANFSFTPNPTNRPTGGSTSANPPIKYQVKAQAGTVGSTLDLEQDETDIMRQEYVDYGQPVPDRGDVVASNTYNTGNYSKMLDDGIDNHFQDAQNQYRTLTQQANQPAHPPQGGGAGAGGGGGGANPPAGAGGQQQQAAPPAQNAAPQGAQAAQPAPAVNIGFSSGYRNPQRNKAVGSTHPESRHTKGQALDLTLNNPTAVTWARLRQAGLDAGNPVSICEHGGTQVQCNDASVNHVHIQWS